MTKERTRIAAIIIKDGKILMERGYDYPELWTPGGKIDGTETDEECLRRELKEELGVELMSSKFFKEYPGVSHYNPGVKMIQRVYICTIEGELQPAMEIKDYLWFSKDDFESKKYPMITMTEKEVIPDLIRAGIW